MAIDRKRDVAMHDRFAALSSEAKERLRIYHERRRAEAEMQLSMMPPVPPVDDTSRDARAVRAARGTAIRRIYESEGALAALAEQASK